MGTTEPNTGVDARQLALVSLCLVALVAAAFLAPITTPLGADGGDGGGGGEQSQEGQSGTQTATARPEAGTPGGRGTATGGEGGGRGSGDGDARRDGEPNGGVLGEGAPVPIPGGTAPPTEGCGVVIYERPVPGRNLTVSVYQDTEPAANTRVWFNDDYVGRTDGDGNVTARVPYDRRLNVTVENPDSDPCEFYRYPYEGEETPSDDGATAAIAIQGTRLAAGGLAAERQYSSGVVPQQATPTGDNSTGEYGVYGNVTVRIEGQPYPGSTVTVNATIEDVPMRRANVSLDGQRVGRTDDGGEYALTVPDREVATVTVARGAYNGSARLEVLQLAVRFVAEDPFIVPGEPVAVNATRERAPVENATVTLDGERLGRTDAAGVVRFDAPASPLGTITASTVRQRATVPVASVYAGTIAASIGLVLLAALTTGATARFRGRQRAKRVATGWAVVGVLFVAFAVGEWLGLAAAGSVVALVLLYRYREIVGAGGAATVGLVAGAVDALRRAALAVTGLLEVLVDWAAALAGRLAAWLGSLPRSVSALARRLGVWLVALPRRSVALLGRLPLGWLGVFAAVVAILVGATVVGGPLGFLVAVLALSLAGAVVLYRRRSEGAGDDESEPGATIADDTAATGAGDDTVPSLRELWRRLARWVLPSRWRTSTPTEISRAARDRGLPREPVERFADAFRDVEYGGRPPERYRETVRTAYEAITDAREDEDG